MTSPATIAENRPTAVRPMLARRSVPFDSDRHLFELKWDGVRALAFVGDSDYRLVSRWGHEITARFPELDGLSGLPRGTLIDGELIALKDAQPHLGSLQSRLHVGDPIKIAHRARAAPITYVVFDLLYDRFTPVMSESLTVRRDRLAALVKGHDDPRLIFSEGIVGSGIALFGEIGRRGLEGVVAKELTSGYRPGRRGGAWLKIKCGRTQTDRPGLP